MVAGFRSSVGTETTDPRLVALVGELAVVSEPSRRLWARHDVRAREGGPTLLHHPEVGGLVLRREELAVGGTDRRLLVVHHAEPGSGAAGLLGSVAAPRTRRTGGERGGPGRWRVAGRAVAAGEVLAGAPGEAVVTVGQGRLAPAAPLG